MAQRLRVVVACEESQAVCKAFRLLGHEAFSCDLQPCSGGHPEWHFQEDCFAVIDRLSPDLVIAHPPCTMLSIVSSICLFKGIHTYDDVLAAREFFLRFLDLPCKVAVENPRPMAICRLPKPTQFIQPYMFGDDYTKLTGLWLKGLPELFPECLSAAGKRTGFPSWVGSHSSAKIRSKTFPGIARAMAEQWGGRVD